VGEDEDRKHKKLLTETFSDEKTRTETVIRGEAQRSGKQKGRLCDISEITQRIVSKVGSKDMCKGGDFRKERERREKRRKEKISVICWEN